MEASEETKSVCERLTTLYINCLLELRTPEIFKDYPDFPKNAPKELLFEPPLKGNSNKRKRSSQEDGKTVRIFKKEKLETVDRKTDIPARKCRFRGNYSAAYNENEDHINKDEYIPKDIQKPQEKCAYPEITKNEFLRIFELQSSDSLDSMSENETKRSLDNSKTFIIKKTNYTNGGKQQNKRSKTKSLSDTSSDEEDEVTHISQDLNSVRIIPKCNALIGTFLVKKLPIVSDDSASIQNQPKPVQESASSSKSIPQKSENSKILKSIFENSNSFDEAMKKYSEKKKEMLIKSVKPPIKIIPAPKNDPCKKKPKKPTTNMKNANYHLGGIFTINNGWDKVDTNKNKDSECNVNSKIKRKITPPNILVDPNLDEDVINAHNEFMYSKDNFMENIMESIESSTDLTYNDINNNTECDKTSAPFVRNKSSVNSSDDSNDEPVTPLRNDHKSLAEDNSHDVICICADDGEFDDFEESTQAKDKEVYSEMDGLKLKITTKSVNVSPKTEFEMNTKKIIQHFVDPETDKILKRYFGDPCPGFLENRCSIPKCLGKHTLLKEDILRPLIINAPFNILRSVFQVALRFYRLFQMYISIFVEICIKNQDELGLIELVKACDRYPRTIECYRDIVRKIVEMDYMKQHKAISFIIDNHTDSEIAREIILGLIVDSGPYITYFINYVEQIHMIQPIRIDLFSRILHACVAFQNPKFPNFCLNYLQACPISQMNILNPSHLKSFIQMHQCLSELNENREAKALLVTKKLLQNIN